MYEKHGAGLKNRKQTGLVRRVTTYLWGLAFLVVLGICLFRFFVFG